MVTVIGFILIAATAVILIRGKVSTPPVFVFLPVVAALICGFSLAEIGEFAMSGLSSIMVTFVLGAFAIVYFNIQNDIGLFDVVVNTMMKFIGNRIALIFIATMLVAAVSHLDGSGSTTVAITIPLMLPFYKKMKINPYFIMFFIAIGSGLINMCAWCPPLLTVASTVGLDAQATWRALIPIQGFGLALGVGFAFLLERVAKKQGAGVTAEEFQVIKSGMRTPPATPVSKGLLIFNGLFTVLLVVVLLFGWVAPALAFMIAVGVAVVVNYRSTKAQVAAIRKQGAVAIYMLLIILSIGVLSGVMKGTGMLSGMTGAILAVLPESLGKHLVLISGILSPIFGILLGPAPTYSTIAPLLAGIVEGYGATSSQLCISLMTGVSICANFAIVGVGPYLALSLADLQMGENLKVNVKWVVLYVIILVLFAAVVGIIPW